jgi:diaminopimelate decarboxylase
MNATLHPQLWPDTATIDQHGHLTIGGCDTAALVRAYGTPLYLLDEATFRAGCRAYRRAFKRRYRGPSAIHYASKALLNLAVAQIVAEEGLGLDVVSGGEQHVAMQAGFPAERIHMHGNAKSQVELEQALSAGVGRVVVDNLDELELLAQLVERRAAPMAIMLRLSPGIAVDTHSHIETGSAVSKFGLPLDALDAAAARIRATPGLRLAGLHVHLGSQIFDYAPIQRAISVLLDRAAQLRDRHGIVVDEISPGGGLGVPYTAEQTAPDLDAYATAIGDALAAGCAARGLPLLRLVIEPGRSLIARAGVALYSVVASKQLPRAADQAPAHDEPLIWSRPPARGLCRRCAICMWTAEWPTIFAPRCMGRATRRCWRTAPLRQRKRSSTSLGGSASRAMCCCAASRCRAPRRAICWPSPSRVPIR